MSRPGRPGPLPTGSMTVRRRSRPILIAALSALAAATALGAAREARADSIIKNPTEHPDYAVELEPHLNVGFFGPGVFRLGNRGRGPRAELEPAFGAGFRATPIIVDPGFIPKLNNTVGITFGIDVASCGRSCVNDVQMAIPVGMQWNFYVAERWSVFGEVGGQIRTDFEDAWPDLLFQAGGRYHFSDDLALTMRAGYPWFSVGLSIFAG
jgi:hypothetical protein